MLTTPLVINTPISSYDAEKEKKIKFQVIGGEQIYGHEIEVQNNVTRETIVTVRQDSFTQEGVIPSNSLINGNEYRLRLRTYNINQVNSEWSEWHTFHCFTEPTFIINNVNNILEYNNYTFEGKYFQRENEELESYQFILYDEYDYPLQTSEVKYDKDISFTVNGLLDGRNYAIELKGETVNNMQISTGKVHFVVEVVKPSTSLAFHIENKSEEGQVKISSNIFEVKGESVNGALNYIHDTYVDLRKKDDIIKFDKGFTVNGNFTMKLWVKEPKNNSVIAEIYEHGDTLNDRRLIEISFLNDRFHLRKKYGKLSPYYIYTDIIPIEKEDLIMIFIKCKDHRLTMETWKVGDEL